MIALQITNLKPFMNKLFIGGLFDSFLLMEATFVTFNTFHIDGTLKKEYYGSEDLSDLNLNDYHFSSWKQVRPFCFELIKGKRTPLEFKIILRLSENNLVNLLNQSAPDFSPGDVNGLFLNLHYRENKMICTTGTSLTLFTLDKTLDHIWDDMVKRFLIKKEVEFDLL